MSFKRYSISRALAALLFGGAELFVQFGKGIMGNNNVKSFCIWTNGLGDGV